MLKVFEPMRVKLLLMEFFTDSIAVSIPTRAMMPNAMMRTVRMVRNKWPRIDTTATRMFSVTNNFILLVIV
jgi:hypothetical protein